MTHLIYLATNKVNNKKYVGQTKDGRLAKRIQEHLFDIPYTKATCIFHAAIDKYGIDQFEFEIIESGIPTELIDEKEKYYIQIYNTYYKNNLGYNMTEGGQGTHGYVFTDADRQKMSIRSRHYWKDLKENHPEKYEQLCNKRRGIKRPEFSPEHRQKLREARLGKDPWNKGLLGCSGQIAHNKDSDNGNAVVAFDLDTGHIIGRYNNAYTAARDLLNLIDYKTAAGRITAVCNANKGHAYNYIWRYDSLGLESISKSELLKEHTNARAKTLLQFDINGNLVAEYESAASYSKTISDDYKTQRKIAKAISEACVNHKKYQLFLWKYKEQ